MARTDDLGPAEPGLAHRRQAPAVEVVRAALTGTLHLRGQKEKYLPKFPKETEGSYKARLGSSVLFNATKRTLKAFTGMVFRKELQLGDDVPRPILDILDNIDLTGRDINEFCQAHFEESLGDGHGVIFVDMQPPAQVDNRADEIAAGLRPYWVHIPKQDILGFETQTIGGKPTLTEFRYRETVTRKDGRWKEVEVHRVRQYELAVNEAGTKFQVVYRVWELDPDKAWPGEGEKDWTVTPDGYMDISRIPVAVTYTGRKALLESDPPFLDLALENLRHYQTDSDNQNLARTAKVQTLVFIGESSDTIAAVEVGPGHAIVLENPSSDAKWIGADGSSFDVFLDDLRRVEQRMAIMGLSMLASDSRAAETASSKRIDKSESDSQLASGAKNLQGSLNEALYLTAQWLGEADGGHIGVNTDFDNEPLDSATFREFRELWSERGLSWETLMAIAVKGELMPQGFDVQEEQERIANEVNAALDAQAGALFDAGEPAPDDEDQGA